MKFRKSKDEEPTAPGQVAIKKRSRVPGVMITQFVEEIPEGMSHPDFTRKPIALTIQEGKFACFKAIVTGNPTPTVTWSRNNGEIATEKFNITFDSSSGEHQIQMPTVSVDQADTYKCFASNEFGRAVVTTTLNVIEVGFKKSKALQESRTEVSADLKKNLKKTRAERQKQEKKDGEVDETFWELLLSADKKDYERICAEYGVTDFRWMLKKLNEKRQEREEQQAQFIEYLSNLKPIEVKTPGCAEFEFEVDLKDPNARIFLYKDGVMVPVSSDTDEKHSLKQTGRKFVFSVNGLSADDAGLYQVDVEGVNIFSTDFKIPTVDFLVKIQEVKAMEREDAVFECVLSHPLPKISWSGKNAPLQQSEKYDITVSEDMLIHRLVVKDCMQVDKGIYAAVAGIKSCNAWLIVEADNDPASHGKKKARKTTQAGGGGVDLEKIAQEQQEKLQKEREERMELLKQAQAEQKAKEEAAAAEAAAAAAAGAAAGASTDGAAKPATQTKPKAKAKAKPKPKPKPKSETDQTGEVEEAVVEEEDVEEVEEVEGDGEVGPEGEAVPEGTEGELTDDQESGEKRKRVRTGPLVPDTIIDPGVHFTMGLSDINAIIGQSAEMVCKLSRENCEGLWYKDGKEIQSSDDVTILKEGVFHKIVIKNCKEEDSGKYRFEADGRKTEAMLVVEDPPRIDPDALTNFSEPVIVKVGQNASFKLSFVGREPMKIQWYNEGEELLEDSHIKIEKSSSHSRLLLSKCQRKATGEIKIKIKNEFGTIEALSKLIVLDRPTPPQSPIEVIEASASCVEFKWRPPKDDGGSPVINYNLERQQLGRNTWKKIGLIPGETYYKDTDVDHGRKYCYRIRAITAEGTSEQMETDDIQAGTKAYPGPPSAPKVVSAFKDCINLAWTPPSNTGGTNILGYNLEKRKRGSNLWSMVNPADAPIREKQYGVKDVVEGMEYEFRVAAINFSGAGEPSTPSEFVFARDPKKPPGKVIDLRVTDSTYTTLSLGWTKPKEEEGVQDEAKGYFVEIRPAECIEWTRCNSNAIIITSFTIIGLKSMAMYWVRVIATNEGGDGEPCDLDNYIIAMPPPVRPRFTDRKMKSFIIVRAGNSARVNINFEASPMPNISWLKDGMPVSKRATVSNTDGSSQLLLPSAEWSDTGIYTIIVKNIVGQETFSTEIRVTDDPKPPGPVELEQNVPGTLTISWTPSPDEKRDDRLHYMVTKRDSVKRTWHTVADRLFNNNFTACNILPGREYNFRVYAKNDMGLSEPSESQTWGVVRKKEKFTLNMPESKTCNFETAPTFLVPLKTHSSPESYECYMSCAVRGTPTPHVTWYRNNISLNTDTNYLISNTCGVCSMLILRVGPKDTGEYKVVAENTLGRAECVTHLTVRE
ncbi:immunoglobulin-like and fibronectin type III domain-containing protein 1 [Chanos chanos]|uniref:immunoglobulin-like and fibronectin type III domain-containing protein 1 n=1 Tax=Chanos chanos TaxID=29144 RepID=UPI0011F145B0|nr:immunoglobulin-like and fibronectin type III domain-containing protein 1 [Chanos chanos]